MFDTNEAVILPSINHCLQSLKRNLKQRLCQLFYFFISLFLFFFFLGGGGGGGGTRCKVGNVQIADVDVSYFLSYFLTQQGTLMAKVLKDGQIFSCTLMPTVEERGLH